MKTFKETIKKLVNIVVEFVDIKDQKLLNFFAPMVTKGRIATGSKVWSPKKWVFEYENIPSNNAQYVVMDVIVRNGKAPIACGDITYKLETGKVEWDKCNLRNQNCSLRKIQSYIQNVVNLFGQINAMDRDAEVLRKYCSPRVAVANGWGTEKDFIEDETNEVTISSTKITYVSTKIGDTSDINYVKKEWPKRGFYRTCPKSGKKTWVRPSTPKRNPALLNRGTEKEK